MLIHCVCTADGVAAMEALRAELAQAKEQARVSNVASLKAAEELRAEQAAHHRSEEKIDEMAIELKDAADRYELHVVPRTLWTHPFSPCLSPLLSRSMADATVAAPLP